MDFTSSTVAANGTRCTIIIVAIGVASVTNGIANIIAIVTAMMDVGVMTRNVIIAAVPMAIQAGLNRMAAVSKTVARVMAIANPMRSAKVNPMSGSATVEATVVASGVGMTCKTAVTQYNKCRPLQRHRFLKPEEAMARIGAEVARDLRPELGTAIGVTRKRGLSNKHRSPLLLRLRFPSQGQRRVLNLMWVVDADGKP